MKYSVLLLLIISCNSETHTREKSEYEMECDNTNLTPKDPIVMRRCENKEVICYYTRSNGAISCVIKRDVR